MKEKCVINDCNNQEYSRKMCRIHYLRWYRKNKNKMDQIRKMKKWGEGNIRKSGHKFITVNGKQVAEHRYLMEKYLGKKLTDNEVVHHINHNPIDNRLENLQVMTRREHKNHHFPSQITTCEHKDKPNYSHGLCKNCAQKIRRQLIQKHGLNIIFNKSRSRLKAATCHPEKPHYAKGLCQYCYNKKYY